MQAVQKQKIDFTEGKVFFKLLRFVLPIIATNLLQTFYNAADMIVVSLSSEENAVGAIGVTGSFLGLILNVLIGFSVGANVVVAREIGAKNKDRVQNAVHTALVMALIFGCGGLVFGLAFSRLVLSWMGTTGNLLGLATRYCYIYALGVPFLALTNYLMAIFRAKGDSKTPLIVLSCAGLLNVGLNLFFVLGVGLSVEGVAIATAIANLASFVVLLLKLRLDDDDTKFSFRKLKINKEAFKDIVLNGVPAGIQGALFSLSNMLIQSSIVTVNNNSVPPGTETAPVMNGSAAAGNLEAFAYTAMNAVYQGAITITSQNVGAKKVKRVKRILYSCILAVVGVGVITGGLIYLLREPLLGLYGVRAVDGDEMAMLAFNTAMVRFRLILLPYFLFGIMDVCAGVLRGMGKAIVSTVISLVGICGLRVVWLTTVFVRWQTLQVIFLSYPVSWMTSEIVMYVMIQVLLKRMIKKQESEETEGTQNEESKIAECETAECETAE